MKIRRIFIIFSILLHKYRKLNHKKLGAISIRKWFGVRKFLTSQCML